jgi:hypothetical protein
MHALAARAPSVRTDDLDLIDALLATGAFETVLAVIRGASPDPALPLITARYVRWSGDLQSAAAAWDAVLQSLDRIDAAATPALLRTTAIELAPLATDLGDVQLAARLHRIGSTSTAQLDHGDDPDAATIRRIAFHTLGLEPDAVRGRLRLRPRLDLVHDLDAHDIRFADGAVSISATVRPDAIEVRVVQDAGAIPLTVLLEPYVAPDAIEALTAIVDGQAAALAPRALDDGTILPVQLVLDEARTLRLVARTEA